MTRRFIAWSLLVPLLGGAPAWAQPEQTAGAAAVAPPAAAVAAEPVRTLEELLERVRGGAVQNARDEARRQQEFLAGKESQQALLEAARAELATAQQRATELERTWERNQRLLGEREQALRGRLGALAEVFAALGALGGDLRARLHDSPGAMQYGEVREHELDELLGAAASGVRLPGIAQFDALWFELQRELADSGRVRRFEAAVVAPDGARAVRPVIRVGNFAVVTEAGEYLVHDTAARLLRQLPRQPLAQEDAAAFAALATGSGPFSLDPGGVRDGTALRAAAAAPTAGERLRGAGMLGLTAILFGIVGIAFALYRLALLQRLHVQAATDPPQAPPLRRLDDVARAGQGLDPAALEFALHEALLRELPALGQGLVVLRAIGTLAPLLGVLGTVVSLATPGDAATGPQAAELAQALLGTVLGLCAGIPVLVLQAAIAARVRDIGQRLDEHAAALVTARAIGSG